MVRTYQSHSSPKLLSLLSRATMLMRHWSNTTKRIASALRRVFGCRHSHMSRRYTINDEPYRSCLDCGARRRLDRYAWTRLHPYYF